MANDIIFPTETGEVASPASSDKVLISQTGSGGLIGDATLASLPVSTAAQAALDAKLDDSQLSTDATMAANSDTLVPSQKAVKSYVANQIIDVTIPDATTLVKGKVKLAGDLAGTADAPTVPNKVDKTTTVNGQPLSANVVLTKSDVGLANADNTSDANKPVSTATATALSAKVDKTTTINGYALSANVSLAKGDVGLGSVDNTSDLLKPVSTATQNALNLKANDSAVVHNTGNETVTGIKTFSSSPIVPTPTTDFQASTKKYVDDQIISA